MYMYVSRNNVKRHWHKMPSASRRFHRFHLINFTGWIYSGNGKLLQGDIYRGGADGRAAWREIKSDCLGKSGPSTRAIGTTAASLRARPAGTPSFRRVVVLHTSRETKNTKNIRIETLADLRRLPLDASASSLLAYVSTHSMAYEARRGMELPRSLTPESISRTAIKHRDVSSVACDRARLINSCRTRPESSCPHFVAQLYSCSENCLFSHQRETRRIDGRHMNKERHIYIIIFFKFLNDLFYKIRAIVPCIYY